MASAPQQISTKIDQFEQQRDPVQKFAPSWEITSLIKDFLVNAASDTESQMAKINVVTRWNTAQDAFSTTLSQSKKRVAKIAREVKI